MTANPLFESTEAPAGAPILALDAGFTATGVVAAVVELLALPVEWVTPLAVKKAATGHNAGSKEQVEAAVLARWPDAPLPSLKCEREHVADAFAAYLAAEHGQLVRALASAA